MHLNSLVHFIIHTLLQLIRPCRKSINSIDMQILRTILIIYESNKWKISSNTRSSSQYSTNISILSRTRITFFPIWLAFRNQYKSIHCRSSILPFKYQANEKKKIYIRLEISRCSLCFGGLIKLSLILVGSFCKRALSYLCRRYTTDVHQKVHVYIILIYLPAQPPVYAVGESRIYNISL